MPYQNEREMYPAVCTWLETFLRDRHPKCNVAVFDASRRSLARLIQDHGLFQNLPPEWRSWDIYVDIVGFAQTAARSCLAFVECKNQAITLSHISQLLGYSRVALPEYAIVVAPQGISDALKSLLITHGRLDVLEYRREKGMRSRSLAIARWDKEAGSIERASLLDKGNLEWL
jgi:hypothetical protein